MQHKIIGRPIIALLFTLAMTATANEIPAFSTMTEGLDMTPWRESRLRGKQSTGYRLVVDDGVVVVRADAEASASALVHEMRLKPTEHTVIRWRWKILRLLQNSDISKKKGDDYPARVYVTFDHDPKKLGWFGRNKLRLARLIYGDDVPVSALCYVWDRDAPESTSVPNAYTDRVQMIVVQSGADRIGEWVFESRNVYNDYREAFGEEPSSITSVVIATDTDDTGETATSWFGDIEFQKALR